jgi:cytoskeletal protein CcmA (bactofilin family)
MWGKAMERESSPLATRQATSSQMQERSPVPAAPVSPTQKMAAAIGRSMRFKGEMYSEEELYLDGEVEGTIEVRARLTIGPNGKVKADVRAKELVVQGSIQGSVEAVDRIAIMKGASIVGDVKTAGIVIEDGAYFKGAIDILRPEAKPPETASSTGPIARSQAAGT